MALMTAVFPALPPNALDRMNGERRVWSDTIDAALSLPTEEERWLALGRVFQEASELTAVAAERLAEEEGLAEDERGLGTVVCADGARVFLVNGLALHVMAAPVDGASSVAAEAAAARWRVYRDEQRLLEAAWAALLRTGIGGAPTRLALPLILLARFRGLYVAACAVWPVDLQGSAPISEPDLKTAAAPLADSPPFLRTLTTNPSAFRLQGPHLYLVASLRDQLARDSLWPSLGALPALLTPVDTAKPIQVEMIPRAGWAEALEAILGAQHEAWHLASSPHSVFYQAAPAPANPRASKQYLGANLKGAPIELRGTVLFVPRFRESTALVRPELGLSAQSAAAEVTTQLEMRLTALAAKLNIDAPMWPWQVVEVMHSVGMPARYIGMLRQRVHEARVRRLILVEATVRVLKCRLAQRQARRVMASSNTLLLHFLNAVFGDGPAAERLWRVHVPHLLAWKFPQLLDSRDGPIGTDLRPVLVHHRLPLLRGLQRAIGVRLKDSIESKLLEGSSIRLGPGTVIGLADIASVSPVVRSPALPHAELLSMRLSQPSDAQSPATQRQGGAKPVERKASTMDPRVLAERADDEAAGWVFVERNAARKLARSKGPAPSPAVAEAKPAAEEGNCAVQ